MRKSFSLIKILSATLLTSILFYSGWAVYGTVCGQTAPRAVLIIGPVVTDKTWSQTAEEDRMEAAAEILIAQGVDVIRFYYPNNDWTEIIEAADGASYLLYRGEGVALSTDPMQYGGIFLGNGEENVAILNSQLSADLNLAPNALVMLYACFSAGSAAWDGNLASSEAQKRVGEYSNPFIAAGASGYFSNWEANSFAEYLKYIFAGNSYGQAFLHFVDDGSRLEQYSHPLVRGSSLWLDSDQVESGSIYNNAFAGSPNTIPHPLPNIDLTPRVFLPVAVK